VRAINREGKGAKLEPLSRKYVPASKANIPRKYFVAVNRAKSDVERKKEAIKELKKKKHDVAEVEKIVKKSLKKETSPAAKINLKNKLDRLAKAQKVIAEHTNEAHMVWNLAKNKLKAQKKSG
jgi:small-conductance mechanosensitive channel